MSWLVETDRVKLVILRVGQINKMIFMTDDIEITLQIILVRVNSHPKIRWFTDSAYKRGADQRARPNALLIAFVAPS